MRFLSLSVFALLELSRAILIPPWELILAGKPTGDTRWVRCTGPSAGQIGINQQLMSVTTSCAVIYGVNPDEWENRAIFTGGDIWALSKCCEGYQYVKWFGDRAREQCERADFDVVPCRKIGNCVRRNWESWAGRSNWGINNVVQCTALARDLSAGGAA